MTIFDVIRYPISDFPTEAELEALPKDLYDKWIETHWTIRGDVTLQDFVRWIASWKRSGWTDAHAALSRSVRELRQMIKDYDEPI